MFSGFRMPERRARVRGTPEGEPPRTSLVTMILGTFREMPGLSLRLDQAARLFGLRRGTCEIVLGDLVASGGLRRAPDGQFRTALDTRAPAAVSAQRRPTGDRPMR